MPWMLLKCYVDIWVYSKNSVFFLSFRSAKTQVQIENGWLQEKKIVNKEADWWDATVWDHYIFFPVLLTEVVCKTNVLVGGTHYLIKVLLQCFVNVKLSSCWQVSYTYIVKTKKLFLSGGANNLLLRLLIVYY